MAGPGTGRGEVGCRGEAAGEEEAVDEQTGPLVICGPGTLSLPRAHLSSRGVGKKRGGDGGAAGGGGGGGSGAENGLQ